MLQTAAVLEGGFAQLGDLGSCSRLRLKEGGRKGEQKKKGFFGVPRFFGGLRELFLESKKAKFTKGRKSKKGRRKGTV